jgi:hypothetical protein
MSDGYAAPTPLPTTGRAFAREPGGLCSSLRGLAVGSAVEWRLDVEGRMFGPQDATSSTNRPTRESGTVRPASGIRASSRGASHVPIFREYGGGIVSAAS